LQTIDRNAFNDLRAHTSEAFVAELVAAFMQEAPKMLADLRRGRDAADAELFRRAAHTLKSNSAMELGGLVADAASDHAAIAELEAAWRRAAVELQEMAGR
jgi:histidine phosphotransfer protein HptB